jgi:hypothetical protein
VGLYRSLSDWYLRAGEGRVETIKALIDAERAVRPVTGVIVFDSGKRIRWQQGVTTPGYDGVAGLFGQLLGDKRFTALTALSSEMYMTLDEDDPLPPRIASFIDSELLRGEVAGAIFGLAIQASTQAPSSPTAYGVYLTILSPTMSVRCPGPESSGRARSDVRSCGLSNVPRVRISVGRQSRACACACCLATSTSRA